MDKQEKMKVCAKLIYETENTILNYSSEIKQLEYEMEKLEKQIEQLKIWRRDAEIDSIKLHLIFKSVLRK